MKILIGFCVLVLLGCNSAEKESKSVKSIDTAQKEKSYFPVVDFIRSEIRYVDSLPVAIIKYTTQNGITDSTIINVDQFHRLAEEFIPAELNKESFEKNFSETSFFDNTTQFASFLYSTDKKDLQVSRVDVLAKPDDVVYNKVNSIYIEKVIEKPDTSIIRKMYWKAGKNFQINTEIRTADQKIVGNQVKVVWNRWE
jgi:hypothetical protein